MSNMASVWLVLVLMLEHLIPYRLEGKLPFGSELAFLESIVPDIVPNIEQPVRDLLHQCIQGLRSITFDTCRIVREKYMMKLLVHFYSLVLNGNHPDFDRILQRIQIMLNSVCEYISQSQEVTREAFRRLLPCLDAYIRGNDDIDLVSYQTFLHNLLSDCALLHQPLVLKLLEFCSNMPQYEYGVCRLEVVVTFLAELLEVMCDNDDPIVVEFLQSLETFHRELEQSLECRRQDFRERIKAYADILKNYAKTGIVDEQAFSSFRRYDSDQHSYAFANPRFMISITGAPAYAPEDVSKLERVKFVLEVIRQAFEMRKKISDFVPYPVPGGEHSYYMPHPVPDALKPLSELRFSLL